MDPFWSINDGINKTLPLIFFKSNDIIVLEF
jgi:hypothetical protein